MSSYQELEYFFESSGLAYGPEMLVGVLALMSIAIGVLLAKYVFKSNIDEE